MAYVGKPNVAAHVHEQADITNLTTDIANVTIGQHTIWIPAVAMIPAVTNGPELNSIETATNKVLINTMDFSTAAEEFVQFGIQMPKSWDRATLVAQFIWSHASTATNFGVVWGIEGLSLSDGNVFETAWGSEVVIADIGGSTDTAYITSETAGITLAGSPAVEDYSMFRITRVVGNVNDTLGIDARLHGIKLHYTTNTDTDD